MGNRKLCRDMQTRYNVKKCILALLLFSGLLVEVKSLFGDVTYYTEWNGNYGSCGLDISTSDPFYVAALSNKYMVLPEYDSNPNDCPLCGESSCIQINGNRGSVVLKISDTCEGCGDDDVDVADSIFPLLDDPELGRVGMEWDFVDCNANPPGQL